MLSLSPVHRVLLARIAEGVLILHDERLAWRVKCKVTNQKMVDYVYVDDAHAVTVCALIDVGLVIPPVGDASARLVILDD